MHTVPGWVANCFRRLLLGLVAACTVLAAQAATVSAVGTADLVRGSDFIFHGKVTGVRVAAGQQKGSIVTTVEFAVLDVLKGEPGRGRVELQYLGGTLHGRTLRIEGLRLPAIGQEGIYFVETLDRGQIHPMYGWDQGVFLVLADAGGKKYVATHDGKPVRAVSSRNVMYGISTGIASGIQLADSAAMAIGPADFKARVRTLVEMQQ